MSDTPIEPLEADGHPVGRFMLVLLLIAILALIVWTEPLWNWENNRLPRNIKIDAVLASDGYPGLMEACEAAVYRLAPSTVAQVKGGGLTYLQQVGRSPNDNPRNRFGQWLETPGSIDVARNGDGSAKTFYGLYALGGCKNSGSNFQSREITQALAAPGSFYAATENNEGIMILAPRYGLAAYYYVG